MEEREDILILTDENGNDQQFEYLDFFEFEGKDYVTLLEVKELAEDEEGTVIIFEVQEVDDETDEFLPVEDETLQRVFEEFKKRFESSEE